MEERARNLVLGALVADAAALGLHWIYDPQRIADVAGARPEFLAPDLAHYRGTTAYFAHGGKRAGDPTHYGEQLLVMLRSLAASGGALDVRDYERRFVATFGPGGRWVGYIDFPTRETLRNVDAAQRRALDAVRSFDLGAFEEDRKLIEAKVMASVGRWGGEQLARAMDKAMRVTHGDDAALLATGRAMAAAVEDALGAFHGADDLQLPAVSKLPPLVAFGHEDDAQVERAVRVTNDRDEAVAWARAVAALLAAARDGASPADAAGAAREAAPGSIRTLLDEACAWSEGVAAAAKRFGRACPLDQAIPLSVVLLREAGDFEDGVRANILAGGDSAGRGTVVGAVLGAAFGIPGGWRDRTRSLQEALALLGDES